MTPNDPTHESAAHEFPTEMVREQASLYALGLMEPADAQAYERHLGICIICHGEQSALRETAAQLPFALETRRPAASLRTRLLTRVSEKPAAAASSPAVARAPIPDLPAGVQIVLGGAGEWTATSLPGVRYKDLYEDQATGMITRLVELDAGAGYPAHRHASAEQCLVLRGDLHFGRATFHGGDFLCAPQDSLHPPSFSEQGCLLLIVTSLHDEVMA